MLKESILGRLICFLTLRQNLYIVHYMTDKVCQRKCKLDRSTNICLGCGRTLEEIIDAGNNAKTNAMSGGTNGSEQEPKEDS